MKLLYLECNMGAAGDMLLAALLELHPQPDSFIERLNALGIPNVFVEREASIKCGIAGTHIKVSIGGKEEASIDVPRESSKTTVNVRPKFKLKTAPGLSAGKTARKHTHSHGHHYNHGHSHSHGELVGIAEIQTILGKLDISDKVRADASAIYELIAEAESRAHGVPVTAVHFHEIGMMDAVADIVGVCMLIEELGVDEIYCSPVHVGSGQVRIAHGVLPVPAPATAYILRGIPTYGGRVQGELCTPTGAALLKHFTKHFGDRPLMRTEAIGYGMGKKDFPEANCVRAFLGTVEHEDEDILEIACNLDDMTGEELGYVTELLMENGALDAYVQSIYMKKNRPAFLLTCLCKLEDEEKFTRLMLRHTTSFGLRCRSWRRHTLDRRFTPLPTPYGELKIKYGEGYGAVKEKYEYEDLARIAREQKISLSEARERIQSFLFKPENE